jgi:hypothetical protein
MLKSKGILSVEPHKGRIVLDVAPDFVRYYAYFLRKKYWAYINTPLHGSHITVGNTKYHQNINWNKAVHCDGHEIEFKYDPYIIEGGYTKGFIMYYVRVFSEELERLKKKLRIIENESYRGLHLTIGNINKGKSEYRLYWPEMISIENKN